MHEEEETLYTPFDDMPRVILPSDRYVLEWLDVEVRVLGIRYLCVRIPFTGGQTARLQAALKRIHNAVHTSLLIQYGLQEEE